eukprot:g14681.t1
MERALAPPGTREAVLQLQCEDNTELDVYKGADGRAVLELRRPTGKLEPVHAAAVADAIISDLSTPSIHNLDDPFFPEHVFRSFFRNAFQDPSFQRGLHEFERLFDDMFSELSGQGEGTVEIVTQAPGQGEDENNQIVHFRFVQSYPDQNREVEENGRQQEMQGLPRARRQQQPPAKPRASRELEQMGVTVTLPSKQPDGALPWEGLAGYELQKRQIEDSILLSLKHPDMFNKIAEKTRGKGKTNRPKVVLFEGPPGTGKTASGRVIARE